MTPKQLVQNLYEAFGRGDISFILAHIAPGCRWSAPGSGIPNAGEYTGPGGVAQFFERLAATENVTRFEVREYFESGSSVIALGYEEVTAVSTGKPAATEWAMLFRVEEGKVTEWRSYYDTSAYLLAHAG